MIQASHVTALLSPEMKQEVLGRFGNGKTAQHIQLDIQFHGLSTSFVQREVQAVKTMQIIES